MMGTNELSASLWRERELLELLAFKLTEEQLLLTSGSTRWLQYATQEVEQVMERLSTASLARTVEVSGIAADWGIPETSTLRELAASAADDTWRDILDSHLAAMTQLTAEIQALRDLNLQYLRAAIRSTQETLAADTASGGTYDARGLADSSPSSAQLFDLKL